MLTRPKTLFLAVIVLCCASSLLAQIVSPLEMTNPAMRRLQQRHMKDLKEIRVSLQQHRFAYDFYFSRKLDMDEVAQAQADQRSIRFDRYNNETALEITGNYYAAYSDVLVDGDHRVRQTYLDVILPILQIAVPRLQDAREIDAFAIEVSHHVRHKVMGVDGEYPENIVVVVPRELAARIVQTKDMLTQQKLMLDAEVYRNGQPTILWLAGEKPMPPEDRSTEALEAEAPRAATAPSAVLGDVRRTNLMPQPPASSTPPPELRAEPLHDPSPDALKTLDAKYRDTIEKMVQEQAATIGFVSYAPPVFINFKQGTYLQISMSTKLDGGATDSQYKLAALAFDHHISHILRPVLSYFRDAAGFDGIDFSTTVKIAGDKDGAHATAVEFVLPFAALNCFQQYDCTGQQLLDAGFLLINGERASVQLQSAEAN